jgi:hypothetical protein
MIGTYIPYNNEYELHRKSESCIDYLNNYIEKEFKYKLETFSNIKYSYEYILYYKKYHIANKAYPNRHKYNGQNINTYSVNIDIETITIY